MFLDKIVARRRERIADYKKEYTMEQMIGRAQAIDRKCCSLMTCLDGASMGVIAEIKQASPSLGKIAYDFDPIAIARRYEVSEAVAISVLTEPDFFEGAYEHLQQVRAVTTKPILNKDFIIDEWQIYQAKIIGADVILLIVAILTDEELKRFDQLAKELGLEVLIEVHSQEELERCLVLEPELIGINNRNLKTFEVSIDNTLEMISQVPTSTRVVSESGIKNNQQVKKLQDAGASGLLVGEHLMKGDDPKKEIAYLLRGEDEDATY